MTSKAKKATDLPASPDHFSATQIKMLQRCPMQYQFRYVEGLKEPPALALLEGSSHHEALQHLNEQFVRRQTWPKLKEVLEVFHESWRRNSKEVADWQGENRDSVEKRGIRIQSFYYEHERPNTEPVAVEEGFEATIDGHRIIGFIDLVDRSASKSLRITDYKVVSKAPSSDEVENHSQLALYSIVKKTTNCRLVLLRKSGSGPVVDERSATFHRARWLDWWGKALSRFARMVQAGIFPPCAPESWYCSPRFCGFWHRCRGAKPRTSPRIYVQIGGIEPDGKKKQRKR